ncbi:hypothetical protein LguiA_016921 [Lonicera macranthoides]
MGVGLEEDFSSSRERKSPFPNLVVIDEFSKDTELFRHCGWTPKKLLPELVDKNPVTAFDVLIRLKDSTEFAEYLRVLVDMNISLHGMEVVNRITEEVEVSTGLLQEYISKCISTCLKIKVNYRQTIAVRIVCVFLRTLIQRQIKVHCLVTEVQEFCKKFQQIEEAASLLAAIEEP